MPPSETGVCSLPMVSNAELSLWSVLTAQGQQCLCVTLVYAHSPGSAMSPCDTGVCSQSALTFPGWGLERQVPRSLAWGYFPGERRGLGLCTFTIKHEPSWRNPTLAQNWEFPTAPLAWFSSKYLGVWENARTRGRVNSWRLFQLPSGFHWTNPFV